MTPVIATREFEYRGEEGIVPVALALGQPAPMPDSEDDWYCPWQIEVAGVGRARWAGGVDAVQALLCAITGVRSELEHLGQQGTLTFLDGKDLMLELPGGSP